MESIIKLTFGLDGDKKAQVVAHGDGALELIVGLARSTGVLSSSPSTPSTDAGTATDDEKRRQHDVSVVFASVRAIKSCVVRNPAGRWRCRSAGVFGLMGDALDRFMVAGNEDLVDEVFTAMAAMCLGNDLNALQGSSQMGKYLTPATKMYPDHSQMQQKILYLQTLFDTLREEQSKILQWFQKHQQSEQETPSNAESSFFQDITQAETHLRTKNTPPSSDNPNPTTSIEPYTHAIEQLNTYQTHTNLLDNLIVELHAKRAAESLRNGDAEACLSDTHFLLEESNNNADRTASSRIDGLKLHARALIRLGRLEEAEESVGKLKILCVQDVEVIGLMEQLDVRG